jgi:beta-lactamase class D
MRKSIWILLCFAFLSSSVPAFAKLPDQSDVAGRFKDYKASFVLLNPRTGAVVRLNPAQCKERYSPCSTFKIFGSLVGLETGVLHNENHSLKWDGIKRPIPSANRDQTLQSAVANSTVWYFQKVASEVGPQRMNDYIKKAHYGNEDTSAGITKFWLASSLKISPDEQVELLKGLLNDQLPFSKRSMAITRGLIRLDQTSRGTLYGKTGTHGDNGKMVMGWFVGYVVQPDDTWIFATNIQSDDGALGARAKELTAQILKDAELL